jgi:hypothetical protein
MGVTVTHRALVDVADFEREERTSGVYAKVQPTGAAAALEELRDITGGEPAAVLLFATHGRPPEAVAFPPQPRRVEGTYSLTHRLSSWLHTFKRSTLAEVPTYLRAWFHDHSVIVVPICTPDWHAGALVVTRPAAAHAPAIRAFAADLALRLQQADRRARISSLGSVTRIA